MSTASNRDPQPGATPASVEARMAMLEEMVERQRATIAQQHDALTQQQAQMRALREEVASLRRAQEVATAPTSRRGQASRAARTSRRKLLQVGGIAAAAGVAAIASELAQRPDTVLADGVAWQTGVVSADNQTWVEPANSSFPDPTLLTVRLGTATPYEELFFANSAAIAAYDTTTGATGKAVYASSATGDGVVGVSSGGAGSGVHGHSVSFAGVWGTTTGGVGVNGYSDSGPAVKGISNTGIGGIFGGDQAPVLLVTGGMVGAPTTRTHSKGEVYLDSAATVWVCTYDGTPGTWVRLPSVANGSGGGAITYLPKPIRLLDTRSGATGALNTPGSPYTAAGSPYPLQIAGVSYNSVSVPAGAVGAIGNVTVANAAAEGGWLALVPHGAGFSGTAVLDLSVGPIVSNSFDVGLASGQLDIIVSNTTNVILDLFAVVV